MFQSSEYVFPKQGSTMFIVRYRPKHRRSQEFFRRGGAGSGPVYKAPEPTINSRLTIGFALRALERNALGWSAGAQKF